MRSNIIMLGSLQGRTIIPPHHGMVARRLFAHWRVITGIRPYARYHQPTRLPDLSSGGVSIIGLFGGVLRCPGIDMSVGLI